MVEPVVFTGSFDRLDVEGLFDNADLRAVAGRVRADPARVDGGDGEAVGTVKKFLFDLENRTRQSGDVFPVGLDEMVGQTGSGFGTDSGKARELGDEACEGIRQDRNPRSVSG
jgi:hypothetical protein